MYLPMTSFGQNRFSAIIFILLIARLVNATMPKDGACPTNITTMADFRFAKFIGNWYTYARVPIISEIIKRCETYEISKKGGVYILKRLGVVPNNQDAEKKEFDIGDMRHSTFREVEDNGPTPDGNIVSVMDTDYENYAVLFRCIDLMHIIHFESAVIMTRNREPKNSFIDLAYKTLEKNGISPISLTKVHQLNCPTNM